MFKKYFFAVMSAVCILLLLTCCSSPEKDFKNEAREYFNTLKEQQSITKRKEKFDYSETASVAYCYPQTGVDEFDAKLEQYCKTTADLFKEQSHSSSDKLLITYKCYTPAEGVFGVSFACRTIMDGQTLDTTSNFNYAKDGDAMPENLQKLLAIYAKETNPQVDTSMQSSYLYKTDSIAVCYLTEQGEVFADIGYQRLANHLPSILKEKYKGQGRQIDLDKKMVALTFDDGPHNTYSNEILDTLQKHNSVATFFEVGNLVEQGADTIKRADAMGCEIASHTWSHGNLQTLSLSAIKEQISKADDAFEKVLGKKPSLLRPPYGAVGKALRENSDKFLIGWSVDTNDWKYRDKDKIISTLKNAGDLDGDVILMHSLYESTADAVSELVPWLIQNDYQLVTVSELVKYKYEDVLEAGKYYAYNYFDYEKDAD